MVVNHDLVPTTRWECVVIVYIYLSLDYYTHSLMTRLWLISIFVKHTVWREEKLTTKTNSEVHKQDTRENPQSAPSFPEERKGKEYEGRRRREAKNELNQPINQPNHAEEASHLHRYFSKCMPRPTNPIQSQTTHYEDQFPSVDSIPHVRRAGVSHPILPCYYPFPFWISYFQHIRRFLFVEILVRYFVDCPIHTIPCQRQCRSHSCKPYVLGKQYVSQNKTERGENKTEGGGNKIRGLEQEGKKRGDFKLGSGGKEVRKCREREKWKKNDSIPAQWWWGKYCFG